MLRSRWCLMMLCLVLAAATAGVRAEDAPRKEKPAKPKMAKTVGTVSAVGDDSLTVTPKAKKAKKGEAASEAEPVTFTLGEKTKVRVDGKRAALSDVSAGYAVTVMADAEGQAVKINAVSPEEQVRRAEAKKARAEKKKGKSKGKGKGKGNAEAGDGEAESDEAEGDQM